MVNPILNGEIRMDSKMPLHYQLMMIIKRNIASHNIEAGDQIPTEEEISNAYGVSRSTVRNALAVLEDDGLINRVRGKGTFISKNKLRRKMEQVYNFSHEMKALGLTPSSRLLEFGTIDATEDLAQLFDIASGEKVYRLMRVRLANDEPLLLETSFLPVNIYPNLTEGKLKDSSLYELLRDEAKIEPFIAEERYESIIFEKKIADVLECQPNSSGFFIERETKMASGKVYELTQSFMRGDRSKIVITLQQDVYTFNRNIDME